MLSRADAKVKELRQSFESFKAEAEKLEVILGYPWNEWHYGAPICYDLRKRDPFDMPPFLLTFFLVFFSSSKY